MGKEDQKEDDEEEEEDEKKEGTEESISSLRSTGVDQVVLSCSGHTTDHMATQ